VCHGPADLVQAALYAPSVEEFRQLARGFEDVPLSGGASVAFELGTLHMPNITPDPDTGIGRYTDGQLARVLRHGVRPNGEAQLPVMEYQDISDEDLVALLSFLRSQPPVHNPVPDNEFSFLGRVLKAFVFRPVGPTATPQATSPPDEATIERGEYVVTRVAQCASCHSQCNFINLSYTGPRLAGGSELEEAWAPGFVFVPPNLTPDPRTGHITNWSEEQFVTRFRAGTLVRGTPMDWEMFRRMSDTDLRAVYRYLMSLDPVENDTGPTVRRKDDG